MINKEITQNILTETLKNGGEFAELFVENSSLTTISCEDNKTEQIISGVDQGAGLRLIYEQKTAYAYTNDISENGLLLLAKRLRNAANLSNIKESMNLSPRNSPITHLIQKPAEDFSIEEKIRNVMTANRAARDFDVRVRQVKVIYNDGKQKVYIANSDGEEVNDERNSLFFGVHAVVADDNIIQTGFEVAGGATGFEIFEKTPPEEIGQRASERAILMLSAKYAPTGDMTVVLSSEAGGTMVHEAVGHGLEGDFIEQGLSIYSKRKGQKVASPLITIIDDGTLPNRRGSFCFDDEGTPAQKNTLIEKGVLKQYMYDRLSALRSGERSTGNGRRQSFRSRPIPRMTNTMIAPGETPPEEIIQSVKKGLFVKKMGGGEVNIVNGDFVFEVSEGYIIENGKITTPVRGATLTGSGPKVMQTIDMVGNDLGFAIGTCGKDGQGAPVSDAQPTLRIPNIIVGGTAQ